MNINKKFNAVCKKYYKEIKGELTCSSNMKLALIKDLKDHIASYRSENPNCTIEAIVNNFGTPKEIASSFESRSDLDRLKKIAKKYKVLKILIPIIALFVVAIVTFTIILIIAIHAEDGATWTTTVSSHALID